MTPTKSVTDNGVRGLCVASLVSLEWTRIPSPQGVESGKGTGNSSVVRRPLAWIILSIILAAGNLLMGETLVPGGDVGTTTWTASGSPYVVQGPISIPSGETLTINPGVQVRFVADAGISVAGILTAIGTEAQPIVFTSDSDTPGPGDWGDLLFSDAGSALSWCTIEYASRAVAVSGGDMTITDSIVRLSERGIVVSAKAYGCDGQTSSASILRCLVEENTYFGVLFYGVGDANTGCTIPKTGYAGGELLNSTVCRNGSQGYWDDGVNVTASDGYFTIGRADPLIRSNRICENGGAGIGLSGDGTHELTIERNLIHHNSESGISSFSSSGRKLILGNSIHGNSDSGVSLQGTGPSLLLVNNTIANNGSPSASGLFAANLDSETEFFNNIIVGQAGQTVINCAGFDSLDPPVFMFNNVFSPGGTAYGGSCLDLADDPSNLDNEDPLFADADLRLRPGSPAIDRGHNSAPDLPTEDRDGKPRISCGTVDIGAYEYRSSNLLVPLPDVDGLGGTDLAAVHTDPATCAHRVYVKDALTKALIQEIPLNPGWRPVDAVNLGDISGHGADDIAVVSVHNVNRYVRVQVRDTLTGDFVKQMSFSPNFVPIAIEKLEDLNTSGSPEVAVLGQRVGATNRVVQIKDSLNGAFIRNIPFSPYYTTVDMAVVPDVSTNGFSELALLGEHVSGDGRRHVQMKDCQTGALVRNIPYSPLYYARGFVVLDETTPQIAVLGEHRSGDHRRLVQTRDASNGAWLMNIPYSSLYTPGSLAEVSDIGSDGDEIAVLGAEINGAGRLVQLKDSQTGGHENNVDFTSNYLPGSLVVFPNIAGGLAEDLAVFAEQQNTLNRFIEFRDAATGLVVKSMTIP